MHSFPHPTDVVKNYILSPSPVGKRIRQALLRDEKPIFAFMNVNWAMSSNDKVMQLQSVFVPNCFHVAPFKIHFFGTERDLGDAAYYEKVALAAGINSGGESSGDDHSAGSDNGGHSGGGGSGGDRGKRVLGGSGKASPGRNTKAKRG